MVGDACSGGRRSLELRSVGDGMPVARACCTQRDEMYIAQRGIDGCSELIGLAEFKGIRFDKDLIRSYLDGRFGGIPMVKRAGSRE